MPQLQPNLCVEEGTYVAYVVYTQIKRPCFKYNMFQFNLILIILKILLQSFYTYEIL